MNTYLVNFLTGPSEEVDADFYEADGPDWSFMTAEREVLRVAIADVASISKAR
jgi:hypothetical protein